ALMDVYSAAASARASEARKLVEEFVDERRYAEAARAEARAARDELEEGRRAFGELEKDYRSLRAVFDETAEELVGPDGVIPSDLRRPLLAIGNRPALRAPIFGILRSVYGAGYRIRHGGRAPTH